MLILIWLLEGLIASGVTTYFIGVDGWKDCWIPIILFIGYFIAFAILYFVFVFILGKITINKKKDYKKISKFHAWLFDITVAFLFHIGNAKIHFIGKEKLPVEPALFVYNHRSKFDSICLSVKIKNNRLVQISKPENLHIPIAGDYMHRCCFMAIDRNNPRNAMRTINKAANFICENKYNVAVAPEGTRNKTDEPLLPFKEGCLKIALKAECPIVICKMYNMEKISKNFPFKKTHVYLYIVDVLKYEDIKDLSTIEIAEVVRSKMLGHQNN